MLGAGCSDSVTGVGVARQVGGVERHNVTGVSIYHEPANDATVVSQHLTALLLACLFVYDITESYLHPHSHTHMHIHLSKKNGRLMIR